MEDRVQDNFTNHSDESMETVKHPQQEIGGQKKATDTELLRGVLENPEVLALFHQKFKELEKPDGQLKWKKPLHVVVGFVRGWGVPARMSLSWVKAILFFFWTRFLQVFNMFSEIRKEKVTKVSEVQRNLKAVNDAHEKVQENAEEVEDQIRKSRENDYKISSTKNKDLEIQLTTAKRDLGNCEDGLSDVEGDTERLKAAIRWFYFEHIFGVVSAVALAAGALCYYYFNPTSLLPSVEDDEDYEVCNRRRSPAKENADIAVATWLTTPALMMIAGSVVMLALPLKWMVESLFLTSMLSTECEKVIKDLQKAKRLQKKLKRAVEIEVPEMKKQLVVLECDISRYASLQKFDSD